MVTDGAMERALMVAFPLMVTDGAMERALMVAFPVREAVTGARTSTMTGNPMSEANMISIGARSMDFWALMETEEPEPERNLDGFSRSSASFSVMISVVFSVRERKMIPVSAPWKNPAAERVSDL